MERECNDQQRCTPEIPFLDRRNYGVASGWEKAIIPKETILSEEEVSCIVNWAVGRLIREFQPSLRGFQALNTLFPVVSELPKYHTYSQFNSAFRYVSTLWSQFVLFLSRSMNMEEFPLKEYNARVEAIHVVSKIAFDPYLDEPDYDFVMDPRYSLEDLEAKWDELRLPRTYLIPLETNSEVYYGWIVDFKYSRTNPNVKRMVISFGRFYKEDRYTDGSVTEVDFICYLDPRSLNLRGKDGLSSDKTRFTYDQASDSFILDLSTIEGAMDKREIIFPHEDVLLDPGNYLELLGRAAVQGIWHGLKVVIPDMEVGLDLSIMQILFTGNPSYWEKLYKRIVAAHLVDQKAAFQLTRKLGIWDASPVLSLLTSTQLDYINSNLFDKADLVEAMSRNRGSSTLQFCPFAHLAGLVNECLSDLGLPRSVIQKLELTPSMGWLMFPFEIFPPANFSIWNIASEIHRGKG